MKLVDFGFAKKTKDRCYTKLGTLEFTAPEVLSGDGYHQPIDVWAFGITICELFTGHTPFRLIEDPIKLYETILSGNYTVPKHMPAVIREMV